MGKQAADQANYRYERKFYVPPLTRQEAEALVKYHPAMFSEIYRQREVNNIYFDSTGLKSYTDNLDGAAQRKKTRIRWYGSLTGQIEKPTLEIKRKQGWVGHKESFAMASFSIQQDIQVHKTELLEAASRSKLPQQRALELKSLRPVLINTYQRKYFLSADHCFRITLDFELEFFAAGAHYSHPVMGLLATDYRVILELKYNREYDLRADEITRYFPFRLSRSSKYVIGIEKLMMYY